MVSVFVSGANGFVAVAIVKELIDKDYDVVGSVRSAEKGDALKKRFPKGFSYEIVPDLSAPGAFDDAIKKHPEVTVFLHVASPLFFNTTEVEKDLVIPAINGTVSALKAIKKNSPQITRVVVTSSYAAIALAADDSVKSNTFTEETWNPITYDQSIGKGVAPDQVSLLAYYGGKTFAEKAAWDFVKDEKPSFVLSTVNPVYVFGPQTFDEDAKGTLNLSAEVVGLLLRLKKGDAVLGASGFVDVRDVARAHLVAFEKDEAKNQRLLLYSDRWSSQKILDVVHRDFPEQSKDIAVGKPGDEEPLKLLATIDNSKTRRILGFPLIDLETSIHDTVGQIFQ